MSSSVAYALDRSNPKEPVDDPNRFKGITRVYTKADVERLRGSVVIRHTLAEIGARRLWHLLNHEDYVAALGALTGNQAVQMARAGLKAIYLSGWQVAADANSAGQMYPDQSLYPVDSVPNVVKKINAALARADQKLLQDVRSVAADHEARRGAILSELQSLAARMGALPRPPQEPYAALTETPVNVPPREIAPLARGGGDWRQAAAQIEEVVSYHLKDRATAN